ncbi:hypothetical protein MKW94_016847 [Papaver nudicaule]|uniref:Fold protein n=1 Tax=Papaver nudicaule TaxID=74823 RepID=A0AA41SAD5_PAPNU|nr:hypothetical protein [Papaver nudicaule]
MQEEEDTQYQVDDMVDLPSHHHHHLQHLNHPHNLSRLSMCSSNSTKVSISPPSSAVYDQDEGDHEITSSADYGFREDLVNDGHGGVVGTYMSRLSIEDSDNDGDEEFSDEEGGNKGRRRRMTISSVFSSDSDKENGCVSLPATPNRRRSRRSTGLAAGLKDYASENELQPEKGNKMKLKNSRRRIVRERWVEKCWEKKKYNNHNSMIHMDNDQEMGECLVITRPKGGRKSLCMDKDEVKACEDLGFELEHGRVFEIPSRISISAGGSTIDTSSGGNSPIASWRISSPGDDPRDVKARLKVWAQAVALASTSRSFG